jgi:hypothetical protein
MTNFQVSKSIAEELLIEFCGKFRLKILRDFYIILSMISILFTAESLRFSLFMKKNLWTLLFLIGFFLKWKNKYLGNNTCFNLIKFGFFSLEICVSSIGGEPNCQSDGELESSFKCILSRI